MLSCLHYNNATGVMTLYHGSLVYLIISVNVLTVLSKRRFHTNYCTVFIFLAQLHQTYFIKDNLLKISIGIGHR